MDTRTNVTETQRQSNQNGHKRKSRRPAKTFAHGNIRTSIWGNPTYLGDVVWKIRQERLYSRPGFHGIAQSYEVTDLWDVMRGAQAARVWIRKKERWLWFRRYFFRYWYGN